MRLLTCSEYAVYSGKTFIAITVFTMSFWRDEFRRYFVVTRLNCNITPGCLRIVSLTCSRTLHQCLTLDIQDRMSTSATAVVTSKSGVEHRWKRSHTFICHLTLSRAHYHQQVAQIHIYDFFDPKFPVCPLTSQDIVIARFSSAHNSAVSLAAAATSVECSIVISTVRLSSVGSRAYSFAMCHESETSCPMAEILSIPPLTT